MASLTSETMEGWVLWGSGTPQIYSLTVEKSSLGGLVLDQQGVGGPQNILEVANIEVVSMVEVEVFKEKQSFVSSKGMGSAARGWVAQIASRQNRAQSPGMHARLLRVRDDLLQLPQLL